MSLIHDILPFVLPLGYLLPSSVSYLKYIKIRNPKQEHTSDIYKLFPPLTRQNQENMKPLQLRAEKPEDTEELKDRI